MRGFLPIGATTNLSWTTDLKNFNDHVARLKPLCENYLGLKEVLDKMTELVSEEFPNSVLNSRDDGYIKFANPYNASWKDYSTPEVVAAHGIVYSYTEYSDSLDFASWRDQARHRSVRQLFPTFPNKSDWVFIHGFYLNELDGVSHDILNEFLEILDTNMPKNPHMYDLPMGVIVNTCMCGFRDTFDYIVKLRTSNNVHPTLRQNMLKLASKLDINIKPENSNVEWKVSSKRGTQTISEKKV